MKKTIFSFLLLGFATFIFAQVGINNTAPKATLDVTAKTTDGSRPEGIIAPRLTGDQIKAGDAQYGNDQKGAIVYATSSVNSPSAKTIKINAEGYYYFDGTVWKAINAPTNSTGKSIFDLIYSNSTGGSLSIASTGTWSSTTRINLPFDKNNIFNIPAGRTGVIQLFYGCWGDNANQSGLSNPSLLVEYTLDGGTTWTWLGNVSQTFNPSSTTPFRFSLNYSSVFNFSSSPSTRTVQFRLRAYNPDATISPVYIGWYLSSTFLLDN